MTATTTTPTRAATAASGPGTDEPPTITFVVAGNGDTVIVFTPERTAAAVAEALDEALGPRAGRES